MCSSCLENVIHAYIQCLLITFASHSSPSSSPFLLTCTPRSLQLPPFLFLPSHLLLPFPLPSPHPCLFVSLLPCLPSPVCAAHIFLPVGPFTGTWEATRSHALRKSEYPSPQESSTINNFSASGGGLLNPLFPKREEF